MARVLVLVLDPDLRALAVGSLAAAGHEVVATAAAQEAVTLATTGVGVHLAVVDVGVAAGAGLAVLDTLRRRRPALPAVVVSTRFDGAEIDLGGRSAVTVLPAPWRPAQVVAAVGAALGTGPVAPARKVAAAVTAPDTRPPGATTAALAPRPRVLVVDDEPDLCALLCEQLREWGYDAVPAGDGASALRLALDQPFELALLDIDMPGPDGLAVTAILRRDPRTTRLPVVLLTARSAGHDVAEGLLRGADDYIRKPFSLAEVRARVDLVLARRTALDALEGLRTAIVAQPLRARPALRPAVLSIPAQGASAGGDLHALLDGPGGAHIAIVGDVGGHGPSVAALAAHLREVLTNHGATTADPARLLGLANASVLADGDRADSGIPVLVTMVCLVLDPQSGRVCFASAGHPPPVLVPGPQLLEVPAGPPLGAVAEPVFAVGERLVPLGSTILLMSDGLLEGKDTSGRVLFGEGALDRVLRHARSWEAETLVEEIGAAFAAFTGQVPADDLTVLALTTSERWGRGSALDDGSG